MKTQKLLQALLWLSLITLLGVITLVQLGYEMEAKALTIVFFVFLLAGINGNEFLKGFSFTIWVIAAATISMIFPQYITEVGGFKTEVLIVPLIQLIMFGMGTAMGLKDFIGVLKMPKGVFIMKNMSRLEVELEKRGRFLNRMMWNQDSLSPQ